jgi:MYXO-CTERM domain-containing protein
VSDPIPDCCVDDSDCNEYQECDLAKHVCVDVEPPGTTGGEETGTPEDTGPADTGVDDTGGSGGGSGAGDTAAVDTGSEGSTGAADTGPGLDSGILPMPGDTGCGCTTTPSPQGRLWWLMLPLGLVLRRRRRAA